MINPTTEEQHPCVKEYLKRRSCLYLIEAAADSLERYDPIPKVVEHLSKAIEELNLLLPQEVQS